MSKAVMQRWAAALALGMCALACAQAAPAALVVKAGELVPSCHSLASAPAPAAAIAAPPGVPIPRLGVIGRVLIEYQDPRAEPTVSVAPNSGDRAFADAVVKAAKTYCIECLQHGPFPPRFEQQIGFSGSDAPEVIVGKLRFAAGEQEWRDACYRGMDGQPRLPWVSPWTGLTPGPNIGNRREDDVIGLVSVNLTFNAPGAPPQPKVLFRRGGERLEESILEYVSGHQMVCMQTGDPPHAVQQTFLYQPYSESAPPAPELTLRAFLGAVDEIAEQKVRFDFTTMGCPFKIRPTYFGTYFPNHVIEIGDADLNRRKFTQWLTDLRLAPVLGADDKFVAREIEVSVPCLVLDLT